MTESIDINITGHAAGRFKFEAFKADAEGNEIPGTRRIVADWFDNLIVNGGMNLIGDNPSGNAIGNTSTLTACRVGTGSTAPAVTDTALVNQVAATTTVSARTSGVQATTPYFGWFRTTYRFAPSGTAQNLAEVGVATAATGGTLFSRALIVDGGGSPTTIQVLGDESLDVTYELRLYPPLADMPWSATISGTNYSGIARADRAGDATAWNANGPNWRMDGSSMKGCILATSLAMNVYNGTIGAITATPSGTAVSVDLSPVGAVTAAAYTANSFQRSHAVLLDLAVGNVSGGISAFRIMTGIGGYQFSASPAFAKDSTKRLTLNITFSWARYTP